MRVAVAVLLASCLGEVEESTGAKSTEGTTIHDDEYDDDDSDEQDESVPTPGAARPDWRRSR